MTSRIPRKPRSTIGWIVEGLRRRRAQGVPPFAVLSCDNLPDNGAVLHRALVAFARLADADLARWIEAEVVCPRTMVDSITPATDDALRTRAQALTGVMDEWPIQREPFTQWVVEDLPAMRDADWQSVGVTLAKDVGVYDRAKLRLLNGPHSTLAYLGLLRGHESVADAMRDEQLAQFVELLMTEDLAPSLGSAAGPRRRALHLRGARAFPQSRHPAPAEPDRLGWLEEAARAHRGHDRRSPARRPSHSSAGDAASPPGCASSCARRRPAWPSSIRMPRGSRASARPAPAMRAPMSRASRCANRSCRRRCMADERFRRALETAYDRLGAPHAALTPELSS